MQTTISSRFQNIHPVLYRVLILTGVSLAVYLFFRFLLPLVFPFLLSYLFMRMLLPVVRFFRRRWHFPGWLAYGTTLTLFFSTVLGGTFLLVWQLWKQVRLFLANFPVYRQLFAQMYSKQTGRLCHCLDTMFCVADGTSISYLTKQVNQLQESCYQLFSDHAGSLLASCFSESVRFLTILFIIAVSMIVLCKDMRPIHQAYRKSPYYATFHQVALTLKETGLAYLKSQGIILLIIWFFCSVGFMIMGNPYGILLGLFVAIFDTFPVLGSGMILTPWGIYEIFRGNYFAAAVLFTVLFLCVVSREILEAHLMGNNMGLLPFFMTAAIYLGVCLFGVWGIFLGPFGVILIRTMYSMIV